jgi:hypothetical protein
MESVSTLARLLLPNCHSPSYLLELLLLLMAGLV